VKKHVSTVVLEALGDDYTYQDGNQTFYRKANKWWKFNRPVACINNRHRMIVVLEKELAEKIEKVQATHEPKFEVMLSTVLYFW